MLTVSLHRNPDLQNGVSSNPPNKTPYAFLMCAMNATCHTHLILLGFNAVTICSGDYSHEGTRYVIFSNVLFAPPSQVQAQPKHQAVDVFLARKEEANRYQIVAKSVSL
jgi:hypothetical protein